MLIEIERTAAEPVYIQIARQVRAAVAAGKLAPGSGLPSVRTLASDLGVNLNTVARAYRRLEAEGFLRIRHRSGVEVAPPAERPDRDTRTGLVRELDSVLERLRQAGCSPPELRRIVRARIHRLAATDVAPVARPTQGD